MISVLIPAYNAEKTIKRCLDSLMCQTCKEFEVVIIDDGSSDNTFEIIKEYQKLNCKIIAYKSENCGVSVTRQKLLEISSGDYIMFCDADDYFESNAIERISDLLTRHPVDAIIFWI